MDGSLDAATERELVGEVLTTWSVSPDGRRARLGFADGDGDPCRLELPVEAVSGLLMTLPCVLQSGQAPHHLSSKVTARPCDREGVRFGHVRQGNIASRVPEMLPCGTASHRVLVAHVMALGPELRQPGGS